MKSAHLLHLSTAKSEALSHPGPTDWAPSSWRAKPAKQLPTYPDLQELQSVEARLSRVPPLIFEGEIERLRQQLARVAAGEAFLLQGGDCAESFHDFTPETIRNNFRILLQMAIVLTFGAQKPVVKIGRVAGQFAKPRSSDVETHSGQTLPSYRGDMVNGHTFDEKTRRPDPTRLERAYFQAAATLNILRAYASGGFADLHHVHEWNMDFVKRSSQNDHYQKIAHRLTETLGFMKAAGLSGGNSSSLQAIEFFTSHEALLLNYEEALTRQTESGSFYAGSGHMLWIGDRTRQLDGAHIEFARGVRNPLGLKCGPDLKADDLLRLIDRLNPNNEPGRLTLIPRMGVKRIESSLPDLIRRVKSEGRTVVWCCDPMHGNTYSTPSGLKTRSFDDILSETRSFFEIHAAEGTQAGGVHVELTGRDVVECTGGIQAIVEEHLAAGGYETLCDPRLNASQALELAFQLVR